MENGKGAEQERWGGKKRNQNKAKRKRKRLRLILGRKRLVRVGFLAAFLTAGPFSSIVLFGPSPCPGCPLFSCSRSKTAYRKWRHFCSWVKRWPLLRCHQAPCDLTDLNLACRTDCVVMGLRPSARGLVPWTESHRTTLTGLFLLLPQTSVLSLLLTQPSSIHLGMTCPSVQFPPRYYLVGEPGVTGSSPKRAYSQKGCLLHSGAGMYCSRRMWGLPPLDPDWACSWNTWIVLWTQCGLSFLLEM